MNKRSLRYENKEINRVLKYQKDEIDNIGHLDIRETEENIRETEELLKMLGVELPQINNNKEDKVKLQVEIPSWEELVSEAESKTNEVVPLESLLSKEDIKNSEIALEKWNQEFNSIHRLDKYDIAISALGAIVGAMIDLLLVGIPHKTPDGLKAGKLSDYIREYFNKKYPEAEMEKLANSKASKVPFDAQDNRHTKIKVEGLSAYYHRLLSLGHDPVLGFVVGVLDIMNGNMTTIDKNGKFVIQAIDIYAERKEGNIFKAFAKQLIHFKSDITTSMGLPAPLMGLFNLLQFGSIGEEEQTIAEVVQGMYYEGYDFIHFCSMSIPVMITEVVVRLLYSFKRIKEGNRVIDSIPFSLNREKNPKLATMLFIAHSGATAINLGKVRFTKNPMAINYPQWITFAKYSYQQLKWVLIEKPLACYYFIEDKIDEELEEIYEDIDHLMEEMKDDVIFVESKDN